MHWITEPQGWVALATLTALEIVLGIDNIIFISILAGRLPVRDQARGRRLGLAGAFVSRLLLLFGLAWIVRLTRPLFAILGHDVSGRDLILFGGGLFLIAKATFEIHGKLEGEEHHPAGARAAASLGRVVFQILLVDMVFSLDSVITAVGMASELSIMIAANVIALAIMLWASGPVSAFVDRHPTVKMLALSFLILIGTNLVAESAGLHIPRGYTYFAMGFSVVVEMLNLRLRQRADRPVHLHQKRDYDGLVAEGSSD